MVSIREIPSVKYWQNLRKVLDTTKEKIPKKYRIGDTCFMSLETIGGNISQVMTVINHNIFFLKLFK